MARCGASYWDLIKTSLGGTPEEPYTGAAKVLGVPDPEDWHAWRSLATQLHEKATAEFTRLGEVETAKGGRKHYPEWNKNLAAQHEMHAKWEALGSFWTTAPAAGIPQAIAVCEAAVCLLEGVDASLEIYGEKSNSSPVPPKPGALESAIDSISGIALLALVGYGVYKLDQNSGGGGDDDD